MLFLPTDMRFVAFQMKADGDVLGAQRLILAIVDGMAPNPDVPMRLLARSRERRRNHAASHET